jgi:hypothetical protein
MGCHTWDNVWWSMGADAPLSAEPLKIVDLGTETFPLQMIVKWQFPAKGKKPAWTAYWYESGLKPDVPEEMKDDPAYVKEKDGRKVVELSDSGNLFIGTTRISSANAWTCMGLPSGPGRRLTARPYPGPGGASRQKRGGPGRPPRTVLAGTCPD